MMSEELKAGRELDIRIATEVMEVPIPKSGTERLLALDIAASVPYSTDLAAAWEVVKKYRLCIVPYGEFQWTAFEQGKIFEQRDRFASDTVSLAICKCALDIAGRTE